MEFVGTDINTIALIESEAEFGRAKIQGVWDVMVSLITGQSPHLLCFNDTLEELCCYQAAGLGLRDIPIKQIVGSFSRCQEFSRRFLPRQSNIVTKERWRKIYTLAVTGVGFPPIEVYSINERYFVKDGHHRVSVARYLGWQTVQAYITEVSPHAYHTVGVEPQLEYEGV